MRVLEALVSVFVACVICGSLQSCGSDKGKYIPDVSQVEAEVNLVRFDQVLFSLDTNQIESALSGLLEKHPDFSQTYFEQVLRLPLSQLDSTTAARAVRGFLSHPSVRQLYDTTQLVYPELTPLKEELEQAFRFYKYYFPENEIPDVYTFISEYSFGVFVSDPNILALGLDFFLGADYPYYDPNFFPQYIKRTMQAEYMPVRAMEALISDLAGDPKGQRLLDLMIHNGKQLYVLDRLLPYTADSIKLGYTQPQVAWVKENEAQMWAHFLTEDLLYSTEFQDIRKLVDHSPNSPGMPPEAPGRTANWMGFKIVESYMDRYPETSLTELLALSDAQSFLEKSRYKPKI